MALASKTIGALASVTSAIVLEASVAKLGMAGS